jgi:UDP-N-acetylmuramate dehydrogenase
MMAARRGLQSAQRLEFPEAEVRIQEPMAPRTSVRVGGTAELFIRPRSADGVVQALRHVHLEQLPLFVIGGGANTLVGDGGIPGVTLKLPPDLFGDQVEPSSTGAVITLGGGTPITRVVQVMKSNGLAGAEFLAGIPGTIGGALAMNAGTKMGECMSVVDAAEIATPEGIGWIPAASLSHGYRHVVLPANSVVTRVRFVLPKGERAVSQAAMDADLAYRKRTQPTNQPSFGSVFENPPGDFAGRIIERVGLKGHTIGRAQISALHANWIVNLGGARARDIVALMELAQSRVFSHSGVELKPEVKKVGIFQ